MRFSPALSLLTTLALSVPTPAQIGQGEVGLYLATQNGSGGTTCTRTFSCAYQPATLTRGETITVVVRGVYNQPFAVGLAGGPQSLCLPIPGFLNSLVFWPVVVPFSGVLDQRDPILACPGGMKQLPLQIPMTLPLGGQILFQALAWSYYLPLGETPTFTQAVQAVVQ